MASSTVDDFLRTIRKVVLHYVGLISLIMIAFGALAAFLTDSFSISWLVEWRAALLAPTLALIVGFFAGWGVATRLHADTLRIPVLALGAFVGAAVSLAALIAGLYAAGMPSEVDGIFSPAMLVALYLFFVVAGLFLVAWSYLTAGWFSWWHDYE